MTSGENGLATLSEPTKTLRFLCVCLDNVERKVLRQLDIETSRTIAIEVVSGVGEVADDSTPISLWALGDQMLIRVWQQKVSVCMRTSESLESKG